MSTDISLKSLFYAIQALKREIERVNQMAESALDEDLADWDAVYLGCETALEELKVAYQEKLRFVSNYPSVDEL